MKKITDEASGAHALAFEEERAERELRRLERERDSRQCAAADLLKVGLAMPGFAIAHLAYHDARCAVAFKNGELKGIRLALERLRAKPSAKVAQLKLDDDADEDLEAAAADGALEDDGGEIGSDEIAGEARFGVDGLQDEAA